MGNLDNTSIALIIGTAIVLLWVVNSNNCENFSVAYNNTGPVVTDSTNYSSDEDSIENESNDTEDNSDSIEGTYSSESTQDGLVEDDYNIPDKIYGRNHKDSDEFKAASYNKGKRGGGFSPEVDKYFMKNSNQNSEDFTGVDVSGDAHAQYISSNKKKKKDDIFNSKELLPREENTDWFETHDNVKVKNRHLINVYRPIGVNTVASSLKNASRDFRGDETNPRFVVSPWNQSSIDPDTNNRGLCPQE